MTLAATAIASLTLAAPAHAQNSFSPEQRNEIVEIVRNALKTDPSILSDAISAIRAQAQGQAQGKALAYVKQNQVAVQSAPAQMIRGNPAGTVTVVEYLDPRCPYCRRMTPVVKDLLAKDHDVRFVEKLIPILGQGSTLETQAIMAAAQQNGYAKLRDALMSDSTPPTLDRIKSIAQAQGLNVDKLMADMHAPETTSLIETNLKEARGIDLDGTPTFIFGTSGMAPGALTLDDLESEITHARKAG